MIGLFQEMRHGRHVGGKEEHDVIVDGLDGAEQEGKAAEYDEERADDEQQPVATSRYVGTEVAAYDQQD